MVISLFLLSFDTSMLKKVDFYNLPVSTMEECLLFSCKLINKASQQISTIYIHCQNAEQRQQLSQLLWQFKPNSFIAHDLLEENRESPIVLGFEALDYQTLDCSLLINLSFEIPKHYQQFARITEFVINDPLLKDKARHNYRFYQAANYSMQYHTLTTV